MTSGFEALPGLLDCMHCGLCLQSCPTYNITSLETDSPRGRLFLMRAVAENRLSAADAALSLERCLQCYGCEPACPSKVPYGQILTSHVQLHPSRPTGISHWLSSKSRMRFAGRVLRFCQRTGLLKVAQALPHKRLRRAASMVPRKATYCRPKSGTTYAAHGSQRGIVALHLGCVEAELFGRNIEDSIAVLTHEGFEVVCPKQPSCCGAAATHDGQQQFGLQQGQQTLQQLAGFDAILVPAAGCSAFLNSLSSTTLVVDPMIFLAQVGLRSSLHPLSRKVVMAMPCHRQNILGNANEMRAAIRAIPQLELVESVEAELCCGAGGTAFLQQPTLTDAIGKRKAKHLLATAATQVVSGNPGCAMQIEAKLREQNSALEVVHPIGLLRESLGI